MKQLPKPFQQFTRNYPQITAAYETLAEECHKAGPLNYRERFLVKLGLAMGARAEGSVHSQVRKGLDAGITPDEIRHAVLLSLTSIGFSNMMASLTWVNDLLNGTTKKR